jgi:hypothetical protein
MCILLVFLSGARFLPISCLAYSSTLQPWRWRQYVSQARRYLHRTTWRYIPEYGTLRSLLEVYRRLGGEPSRHTVSEKGHSTQQYSTLFCGIYSQAVKILSTGSSETSMDFHRTTRGCILEERTERSAARREFWILLFGKWALYVVWHR